MAVRLPQLQPLMATNWSRTRSTLTRTFTSSRRGSSRLMVKSWGSFTLCHVIKKLNQLEFTKELMAEGSKLWTYNILMLSKFINKYSNKIKIGYNFIFKKLLTFYYAIAYDLGKEKFLTHLAWKKKTY